MFNMFTQLFATVSMFLTGIQKFASAFNHIGTWTDETAGAFSDEARINRMKDLNSLNKELAATQPKQLTE